MGKYNIFYNIIDIMLNKYYDCMSYSFLEYCGMLVSLDVNLSFHVINASVIFRLINVAYLEFIS